MSNHSLWHHSRRDKTKKVKKRAFCTPSEKKKRNKHFTASLEKLFGPEPKIGFTNL